MNNVAVSGLAFLGPGFPVGAIVQVMAGVDGQYVFTDMFDPGRLPDKTRLFRVGARIMTAVRLGK